jgi:enoyl-CoA hydratase/carnithine racemase
MAVSPSSTDELLVEQHDKVVVITLNRPERLNAISRPMLNELSAKMVEANKDPDTRCIVLTGAGRGFCAGLDLIDTGENMDERRSGSNQPRQLFDLRDAPSTAPQPATAWTSPCCATSALRRKTPRWLR